MSILVIAEHDNNSLKGATLNTVAAAVKLEQDITVLIAGSECGSVVTEAQTIDSISKVIAVDNSAYKNFIAEELSALVLTIASDYSYIMAPATTFGKNLLPRISAKLDSQQISDIISVESGDTFKRPIYAGSCIATVKSNDSIKVISVRSTAFDAIGMSNSDVEVVTVDAVNGIGTSEFVSEEIAKSDRPELTAANIVISGGRGMQSGDNFHLLDSIADKLGAAVGASRAAVDAGYVPNDYQVGQTGKIVAPDLYIAVGISGAIQHLAGMKDSKVIVAINKDEDAPIFQVADYGLVSDLFTALPEEITRLPQRDEWFFFKLGINLQKDLQITTNLNLFYDFDIVFVDTKDYNVFNSINKFNTKITSGINYSPSKNITFSLSGTLYKNNLFGYEDISFSQRSEHHFNQAFGSINSSIKFSF